MKINWFPGHMKKALDEMTAKLAAAKDAADAAKRAADSAKKAADEEAAKKWLNNGAQPTETVAKLLKKAGIEK